MKYTEKTDAGRLFNKMVENGSTIIDAKNISENEMLIFWRNKNNEYWTGLSIGENLTDIQIKHQTATKAKIYFYHENSLKK